MLSRQKPNFGQLDYGFVCKYIELTNRMLISWSVRVDQIRIMGKDHKIESYHRLIQNNLVSYMEFKYSTKWNIFGHATQWHWLKLWSLSWCQLIWTIRPYLLSILAWYAFSKRHNFLNNLSLRKGKGQHYHIRCRSNQCQDTTLYNCNQYKEKLPGNQVDVQGYLYRPAWSCLGFRQMQAPSDRPISSL